VIFKRIVDVGFGEGQSSVLKRGAEFVNPLAKDILIFQLGPAKRGLEIGRVSSAVHR
jgi:hypothetical protein